MRACLNARERIRTTRISVRATARSFVGATLVVALGRPQGPPLRKNEPATGDRRYNRGICRCD